MVQLEESGERPVTEASGRDRWQWPSRAAVLTSGWLPAGLVSVLVLALWLGSGVSVRDTVVFSIYLGVALVVPGTLVWRRIWGERPRPFALDLMAGLMIGYTIELPVYLLARAVGLPALTPLWALAVIGLALVVPSQRGL